MIEINGIYKRFGKLKVLEDLDLELKSPGVFAIIGPNASGKTTLIKAILGIVIPDAGEIKINQRSVLNEFKYRNQLTYLPQIANFPPNLTVGELISLVKELRQEVSYEDKLISIFNINEHINKKIGNLSGGTIQKVNLILTFMFDSDLIILDEPTNGLDPISMIHLEKIISEEKKKGKTILITTHVMRIVERFSDEIIFLLEGKVFFKGKLSALRKKTDEKDLEFAIAKLMDKRVCLKS
ncbi:MAG: ABC transporter ATP-binding protein [Flavobacteriales bacterium]|jgi:Cu-processing system ATP-binding protein|nr:ABC transporter ATP-binding protein [Flavobacteriales bacterium]